jgi:hypothetical protein
VNRPETGINRREFLSSSLAAAQRSPASELRIWAFSDGKQRCGQGFQLAVKFIF